MVENLVDRAIASLLSTIAGVNVVTGLQDNEPALTLPYCVVWSVVAKNEGRTPVYTLATMVEFNSISGPTPVAEVETMLTAIDAALNSQPVPVTDTGLNFIGWQSVTRTQQNVGDRRKIVRELEVIAS